MKKYFLLLSVVAVLASCSKNDKDVESVGWINYKGQKYDLHYGSKTDNEAVAADDLEGLWLHAVAFTSDDAKSNANFAFYSPTRSIEAGSYTYNGNISDFGTDGELLPASIQISGVDKMFLPEDLKSGNLTIKKSGNKFEFTFGFTTSDNIEIKGFGVI